MRPRLAGRVVIPPSVPPFSAGTLQVWLEDVSYADRAAVVVAETTVADVTHAPGPAASADEEGTVIDFSLEPLREIEPTADYSVRVSLDALAGSGNDALAMDSDRTYPVLTRGHGAEVTVVLDKWQRPSRGAI